MWNTLSFSCDFAFLTFGNLFLNHGSSSATIKIGLSNQKVLSIKETLSCASCLGKSTMTSIPQDTTHEISAGGDNTHTQTSTTLDNQTGATVNPDTQTGTTSDNQTGATPTPDTHTGTTPNPNTQTSATPTPNTQTSSIANPETNLKILTEKESSEAFKRFERILHQCVADPFKAVKYKVNIKELDEYLDENKRQLIPAIHIHSKLMQVLDHSEASVKSGEEMNQLANYMREFYEAVYLRYENPTKLIDFSGCITNTRLKLIRKHRPDVYSVENDPEDMDTEDDDEAGPSGTTMGFTHMTPSITPPSGSLFVRETVSPIVDDFNVIDPAPTQRFKPLTEEECAIRDFIPGDKQEGNVEDVRKRGGSYKAFVNIGTNIFPLVDELDAIKDLGWSAEAAEGKYTTLHKAKAHEIHQDDFPLNVKWISQTPFNGIYIDKKGYIPSELPRVFGGYNPDNKFKTMTYSEYAKFMTLKGAEQAWKRAMQDRTHRGKLLRYWKRHNIHPDTQVPLQLGDREESPWLFRTHRFATRHGPIKGEAKHPITDVPYPDVEGQHCPSAASITLQKRPRRSKKVDINDEKDSVETPTKSPATRSAGRIAKPPTDTVEWLPSETAGGASTKVTERERMHEDQIANLTNQNAILQKQMNGMLEEIKKMMALQNRPPKRTAPRAAALRAVPRAMDSPSSARPMYLDHRY
jgi:hypothetical protein